VLDGGGRLHADLSPTKSRRYHFNTRLGWTLCEKEKSPSPAKNGTEFNKSSSP